MSFARRRRILSCTWWASWRAAEELHRDKCGQSRSQEHSEEQPPRLHSLDMQYGGASPPQRYRYTGGFALIIFSLSRELSQCSRVGFCFIDPLSISGDFFHQPPLKCFPDLDCGEAGYGHGGYSPQLSPRMHRLRNGGGHSYGGGPSYGGEPSNGAGLVRHYPHEYSSHHAPQYSHDYAPQHLRPQDYARQHPRSNYEQHQRHHPHDSAPPHSRPHSEQHRQGGRESSNSDAIRTLRVSKTVSRAWIPTTTLSRWVRELGARVWGFRFRSWGLGCGVQGCGVRGWGAGRWELFGPECRMLISSAGSKAALDRNVTTSAPHKVLK